ncbi:MAG TPA: hypothetical protein VIY29_07015, partial [Ktedonobacteraceae bacterium]
MSIPHLPGCSESTSWLDRVRAMLGQRRAVGQRMYALANGRSRIGSGIVRMTNADANPARRSPLCPLAIGRTQTQLSSGGASELPVRPPLHSQTCVFASRDQE